MSFKRLDPEDFVLSAEAVTNALWTGFSPKLATFFTSSVQEVTTGQSYLSVYQTASLISGSEVQFDIAYGDSQGSGSYLYDISVTGSSPTRTIYGQYRSLVLGDENASFIFGNITSSGFYILNIDRNRYKESLLPGSLTLKLTSGSNSVILTDDSKIATTNVFTDAGRLYNLVSGSAGTVYTGRNAQGWAGGTSALSGSYGWFLPDIGVLLFNPKAISASINVASSQSVNSDGNNFQTLFKAISGSGPVSGSFTLQSQETISADYVFVRVKNAQFNYTENPSFTNASTGEVNYPIFINNPQTYITTIGLYNDAGDLLAVAKMSRPLPKDFTKEALIRVKLDF